ncbi:MAG: TetR family transcriptional regulator [Candidatus Dactylopiibacterium carminicum]|uniref:TetR family transcriptional regulator n=1 Tax=Candidatus Dactylopiibacterium carminicum TaxID=857335 RepID=A0A272EPP2_9RHOO|nr:TetR/AcrR family transcriptional regulator [Candidatus Dactylopiibacterium carminicum]KAF7598499.1 TetR/AcrR family transcriptional regulator [Candidatus Dactylopiibacterium carminicum]PAS92094.1 MAG: TetR family transcriptional regulator [Candidatus Dactylopiibacterium carminicum]PAS95516.1 MAG: TetR family transcriptional regulator [Candidatus Dactylopiibacterium carminicum]PAS97898.1 MAG: TetR family transcriptional regulator [Candidatus Dactylopiibacterium carminicum]
MTQTETGSRTRRRPTTHALDAQTQILEAADTLFYREGARAVGVDAVVKLAGLNKMSLYRQFESKDALLLHYLERRAQRFWGYFEASVARHPGQPREQLLQFFRDLATRATHPSYRGCPFVNIAAEFPDPTHPARLAVATNKTQLMERLRALAREADSPAPERLASGLALLIEGTYAASQTYPPGHPVVMAAVDTARTLLDALAPGTA